MATKALGLESGDEGALAAAVASGDPNVLVKLKEVDAQVKPFGHELDGTEDATRAQQAYLIALSGMAQSGVLMGRKVKIDAGGQSVWYYDPAEHWIEIEDEFLKNGLNPQSIESVPPFPSLVNPPMVLCERLVSLSTDGMSTNPLSGYCYCYSLTTNWIR